MKKIVLFILAGLLMVSCNQYQGTDNRSAQAQQEVTSAEPVSDGIFIHITESYNDPHRVLMPMKMAVMMADDKDVLVYLDIHAVELVSKEAEDLNFAEFESFQTYLKQLTEKGVVVYACPSCMKVAGIQPENLMTGVQTAQKDKFFDFTKGRIITLDY